MPRDAEVRERAATNTDLIAASGRAAFLLQPDRREAADTDKPTSAKSGAARRPPQPRNAVEATFTSRCRGRGDMNTPRILPITCQRWRSAAGGAARNVRVRSLPLAPTGG